MMCNATPIVGLVAYVRSIRAVEMASAITLVLRARMRRQGSSYLGGRRSRAARGIKIMLGRSRDVILRLYTVAFPLDTIF